MRKNVKRWLRRKEGAEQENTYSRILQTNSPPIYQREIKFNNTNTLCSIIFTLQLMTCLEKETGVTRMMCMYLTQQSLSYISRETTIAPVSTCLTHRCYSLYLQDCLAARRPFVVKGISHCDYRHIKQKESCSLIFLTSICLVATSQV